MKRRDFFKLGLGSAGVAVAGGISCGAGEFDFSSDASYFQHAWWVKEIEKPKLGIDDRIYSRFNSQKNVFGSMAKYYGMVNLREWLIRLRKFRKQKNRFNGRL